MITCCRLVKWCKQQVWSWFQQTLEMCFRLPRACPSELCSDCPSPTHPLYSLENKMFMLSVCTANCSVPEARCMCLEQTNGPCQALAANWKESVAILNFSGKWRLLQGDVSVVVKGY